MPFSRAAHELPVLFLYNIDPEWDAWDARAARLSNGRMAEALRRAGHPVVAAELLDHDLPALLSAHSPEACIVFNQCEGLPGVPGSEHEVARIIESLGFACTGAPHDALLLTGDKAETKRLLETHRIPTPRWRVYDAPDAADWNLFPAIVKAVREHCSLSLTPESVVLNRRELETRIAHVLTRHGQPALVEDFIDGREFHVPVWGNGTPALLPVVEMDFSACDNVHDRLCTYDSKFTPESRLYNAIGSLIPAPLDAADLTELERVTLNAYRAVGCRDYARLDVRKRGGTFYVLDVNPNADLDSEASIACAAEHSGLAYPDVMTRLVRLAACRHPCFRRG
jgi:D-alanine-D-alanine ligase